MMGSSRSFFALALLGTVLAAQTAPADTSVHIYASVNQNYEDAPIPAAINRDTSHTGAVAADSVTLHSFGRSARTAGGATAVATEGSLWIRADGGAVVTTGHYDSQGNASMPSQGAWADAEARAAWTDAVTISAPGRAGQPGSAVAMLTLGGGAGANRAPFANIRNPDGSSFSLDSRGYGRVSIAGNGLSWTSQGWDDACAAVGWSGWLGCANALAYDPSGLNNYSFGIPTTIPVVLDFRFGEPFTLGYTVYANAGGLASIAYYKMAGGGDGTGSANLSLAWGGIVDVFDAAGDSVADYDVGSGSGVDYEVAVVVPEPAAGSMLMAGLVSLGWMRRRRA